MIKALTIVKTPAPVLRKKAKNIGSVSEEIKILARNMIMTLVKYDHKYEIGAAIAAPQVGESVSLIVVRKDFENARVKNNPKKDFIVVINPKIDSESGESEDDLEGCLSIPGTYGEVSRASRVTVTGLSLAGHKIKINAEGFEARVFQHEIDHLEGKLFTDRISELSKLRKMDKRGELLKYTGD